MYNQPKDIIPLWLSVEGVHTQPNIRITKTCELMKSGGRHLRVSIGLRSICTSKDECINDFSCTDME